MTNDFQADIHDLADHLEAIGSDVRLRDVDGVQALCGCVVLEGNVQLLVAASNLYPSIPPAVWVVYDESRERLTIEWREDVPARERLHVAVVEVVLGPGPFVAAYGPLGGPAYTGDATTARLAGWRRLYSTASPETNCADVDEALLARSSGLFDKSLKERNVLIVGLGSLGSYMAEQLTRCGIGAMTLIDAERVEDANICRTVYTGSDVGTPKAVALARHLLNIRPGLRVVPMTVDLCSMSRRSLAELMERSQLVIAATDDPAAQNLLNAMAHHLDRPAVFPALYAGASGGEVIMSIPEYTPCLLCATGNRRSLAGTDHDALAGRSGERDYGTGRLVGEVALNVDIQHVAGAAVKLSLSLLLAHEPALRLSSFAFDALSRGFSYLTMSMVPDYWFYPQIFSEAPGQFAYQSVWLTPMRTPSCPVCGEPGFRSDPLAESVINGAAFDALIRTERLLLEAPGGQQESTDDCSECEDRKRNA